MFFVSVRIGEVDTLLTNAHTSGTLSLGLPLGAFLLPVVKALRYQDSLWDLDLSSTKLDDHIFQVRNIFFGFQILSVFIYSLFLRIFVKHFQHYPTL